MIKVSLRSEVGFIKSRDLLIKVISMQERRMNSWGSLGKQDASVKVQEKVTWLKDSNSRYIQVW